VENFIEAARALSDRISFVMTGGFVATRGELTPRPARPAPIATRDQ
jgi:hypothetical protein